jgi:hypothetical protein
MIQSNRARKLTSGWNGSLKQEYDAPVARELWIATVSCRSADVDPAIHIPIANQPAVVTLDLFDDSVPAKQWTIAVPVVAPIRFEIGRRGS